MVLIRKLGLALALLGLQYASPGLANNGATITGIYLDGQPQQSIAGVVISLGKERNNGPVSLQQGIPTGARIQTPARVTLDLVTGNQNSLRIEPNSTVRIAVSAKGENHSVSSGTLSAWVKKKLDFFNITDSTGRFQGAAKSTAYSATVGKGGITFATTEGVIRLNQQVPVSVAGNAVAANKRQPVTVTRTSSLAAEQGSQSFDFDAFQSQPQEFASFEDAVETLNMWIAEAEAYQDWELAVDLYSTLGGMYLDQGDADSAVGLLNEALELNYTSGSGELDLSFSEDHTLLGYAFLELDWPLLALLNFRRAAEILDEIDPYSPWIADSLIDQAEALQQLGDLESSIDLAMQAVEWLSYQLDEDEAILDELMASDDPEAQAMAIDYAWEVSSRLMSIGWALEFAQQPEDAAEVFRTAEELEAFISDWEAEADAYL